MKKQEAPRYTTIIHKIRIELDLTCNEYCVADIIFSLSNNPDAKVLGWCFATKETIAGFMGISKQAIHEIIKNLIKKGLIEKDPDSKYLKTTSLWYKSVVLERLKMKNMMSKESLLPVKKGVYTSKESLLGTVKKGDTYNNKYNNKDKDTTSKEYFRGMLIVKSKGKEWCIPEDGSEWLEFDRRHAPPKDITLK